jgi:hypothetical protein
MLFNLLLSDVLNLWYIPEINYLLYLLQKSCKIKQLNYCHKFQEVSLIEREKFHNIVA